MRWRRVINSEQWFCATPVCGSKNGNRSRLSTHSLVLKLALYSRFCWYADALMNRSIFSKFAAFAIWKSMLVADDILLFDSRRALSSPSKKSCSIVHMHEALLHTRNYSMEREWKKKYTIIGIISHSGRSAGDSRIHMSNGVKICAFDRHHNCDTLCLTLYGFFFFCKYDDLDANSPH